MYGLPRLLKYHEYSGTWRGSVPGRTASEKKYIDPASSIMAQSIKPPYPIFLLTLFSQSLYSSRVNLPRPFVFPLRPRSAESTSAALLLLRRTRSVSFNADVSFFRRRCCYRSLFLNITRNSLSSPFFFLSPSSCRLYRVQLAGLRGFRQQRPTKTTLTDVRRPCLSLHRG